MLESLLPTLVLLAAPHTLPTPQVPAPVALPAELMGRPVETVVQLDHSCFVAQNLGHRAQGLVFASTRTEARVARSLAPGQRTVQPFPRGAANDVTLEVVARDGARLESTGALSLLDVLLDTDDAAIWIEDAGSNLRAWARRSGRLEVVFSGAVSTLGPAESALQSGEQSTEETGAEPPMLAPHVPAVTPRGTPKKKSKKPPVIEKRVLPPV